MVVLGIVGNVMCFEYILHWYQVVTSELFYLLQFRYSRTYQRCYAIIFLTKIWKEYWFFWVKLVDLDAEFNWYYYIISQGKMNMLININYMFLSNVRVPFTSDYFFHFFDKRKTEEIYAITRYQSTSIGILNIFNELLE